MRGVVISAVCAVGCGVTAWYQADSWIGYLSFAGFFFAIFVFLGAIYKGLQSLGGDQARHDDPIAIGGILSRPGHIKDKGKKRDEPTDVSGLAG